MKFDEALQKVVPEEYYSIQEVADILGMSYSAIRGHIARGNVPAKKILSRYFVKGYDLLTCLTK